MYFTIIITDTQSIFRYETLAMAAEKFHSELAYAYNQNINCTCIVMDSHGAVYKSEGAAGQVFIRLYGLVRRPCRSADHRYHGREAQRRVDGSTEETDRITQPVPRMAAKNRRKGVNND